jgi:hypothetical protein
MTDHILAGKTRLLERVGESGPGILEPGLNTIKEKE